jgi:hypothetical protein
MLSTERAESAVRNGKRSIGWLATTNNALRFDEMYELATTKVDV